MLQLLLHIFIISQLLVVDGNPWIQPPKEYIERYPNYDKILMYGKTKNEIEEAKGNLIRLKYVSHFHLKCRIFINSIEYFRHI